MKSRVIALAAAVSLLSLIATALGISVSLSLENGGNTASSSAVYELDTSTKLKGSATLGDGEITKDLTASGSGKNRISISSNANGKSTGSKIESSGEFHTAASSGASDSGAFISQNTDMSGSSGGITYYADSPENILAISGGFNGQGDLSSDVSATAEGNAAMLADINALGVDILDSKSMQIIGSGDVAISIEGLSNDGQGSFGLSAINSEKGAVGSDTAALLTGPNYTSDGGRAEAYTLSGFRWNTIDPQIKWTLKNDATLSSEGLYAGYVKREIESAANTWDDATNQNLFADNEMVTLDSNAITEKYNNLNTINMKSFGNKACLAYARTYYTLISAKKVDGFNSVLDSDLIFNTDYGWCADDSNTGIDFQSVVLHEMGHTLGLGDIYGKTQFKSDTRQVMHYYRGVKRNLGNGDKTAIWNLYG